MTGPMLRYFFGVLTGMAGTLCVLVWLTSSPFTESGKTMLIKERTSETETDGVKHAEESKRETAEKTFDDVRRSNCSVTKNRNNDVAWTPYWNVLSFEEAFKYKVNPQKCAEQATLKFDVANLKDQYTVGDEIRLHISYIYKPMCGTTHGGDDIRVRMEDYTKDAFASGYVIDHRNGSYTGVLKALWAGQPRIFVELKHTRHEIAALYLLRKKLFTVRNMYGQFVRGSAHAETLCLPTRYTEQLKSKTGSCDLTHENAGVPWYCERPRDKSFTCKDLRYMLRDVFDEAKVISVTGDYSLFWGNEPRVSGPKLLTVQDISKSTCDKRPFCHEYDLKSLWHKASPIGHFYNNQWHIAHCDPRATTDGETACIKNRFFVFYGDSTIRQWYEEMRARFKCIGPPGGKDTAIEKECVNHELNLKVLYARHNHPGNSLDPERQGRFETNSNIKSNAVETFVDRIDDSHVPVIVLHLYFHYTYFTPTVYRFRVKLLRESIRTIFKKRPDAKVLIKGPHLVRLKTCGTCDYFGYLYRLILLEELSGFMDSVVYLDYADMTNAIQVWSIHPTQPVVWEMVRQMLAYIC